jgi:hypothetical protein
MKTTLVYKRTHEGDPDKESGCWGVCNCTHAARDWPYEAVIGIGGIGTEAKGNGIDGKINWIGICPTKHRSKWGRRCPLVTFKHFIYFGKDGREVKDIAPALARRMYSTNTRRKMNGFIRFQQLISHFYS